MKDERRVRAIADTNTVISGLLWHDPPRQVLDAARAGTMQLYTSTDLLAELEDVLLRPKFVQRLVLAGTTAHELVLGYAAFATIVEPEAIAPVVLDDPDDDAVIACAIAAQAHIIVSGDSHLLDLQDLSKYTYPACCGSAGAYSPLQRSAERLSVGHRTIRHPDAF